MKQERIIKNEKEFWEKHKTSYEVLRDKSYFDIIKKCRIRSNTKGLEVGCGSGAFSKRIKQLIKCEVVGIDLSKSLLKISTHFDKKICGDATNLTKYFKKEEFDWIFYPGALHHIPNNKKTISEAVFCLKKSGKIIFFEPNLFHPHRFIFYNLLHWWPTITKNETAINPHKLKKILESESVRDIKIEFISPEFRKNHLLMKLQKIYRKIFPKFLEKYSNTMFLLTGIKEN